MKVSELARQAGITPTAVRFYESEGILPAPGRSAAGYREYGDRDVCRVRVLVSLRSLGLDLREAGRLAEQCSTGHCDEMAENLLPQIVVRRAEVAAARVELDHLDAKLAALESTLRAGGIECVVEAQKGAPVPPVIRLTTVRRDCCPSSDCC
jgi:DNA-binding transcriptional MerR regulator